MKNWIRYRFNTKSVDDWRPIVFDPHYPFWCSGYNGDMSYAIIIAYLPKGEPLTKYWDDAFDISQQEQESIEFSGRFPKPDYFIESV